MSRLNRSRREWLSGIAALLGGWLCLGGKGSAAAMGVPDAAVNCVEPQGETLYSYCDEIDEIESVTIYEYDELGRVTGVKDEG